MSPFLIGMCVIGAIVLFLVLSFYLAHRLSRSAMGLHHEIMPPPNVVRAALPVRCVNCKHFDIEEGQAAIRQYPQFMKAAEVIPPSLMGARAEKVMVDNDDGTQHEAFVKTRNKGIPAKTTWDDLGACMRPTESGNHLLVYNFDKCEHFEEKERS